MKDVIVRWAKSVGVTACLGTIVFASTGCGVLGAAANPKVAWAINDPAPMSVVVRRADVAEKTAQQVDRVMTDTPTDDDSPWLGNVGPQKEDATKTIASLRDGSVYAAGGPGQGARIVPAEVWAKSLAQVEPKQAAKAAPAAAPAATGTAAAAAAPAPAPAPKSGAPAQDPSVQITTLEPAEPVAKAAEPAGKPGKGKGKGKGAAKPVVVAKSSAPKAGKTKGDKKASKNAPIADKAAPASEPEVAPAPAAAAAPAPAAAKVVVATPVASKYPSLLAAIDQDLGVAWAEIMEKKKAAGDLKTQIAAEKAANEVQGVSEADKKAHEKTIAKLDKEVTKLDKQAAKLTDAFLPKAKAAAKKAPADVRARFGAALVNLEKAVDDAKIANGAAAVRYPMAATTLLDSAKQMAAIYVADVIEEKTGKRPSMAGIQPGVTMEGGKVNVTLNGLNASDMGKLSMTDLTTEVAARSTRWVGRVAGLLGTIDSTGDMLSFEDDVLLALIDGFKSNGWTPPAPAAIPDGTPGGGAGGATAGGPSAPSLPKI